MKSGDLVVLNNLGLHARAAAKLVHTAAGFESRINLSNGTETADAKGIMGLMMLAATKGTRLNLQAEGADEDEAFAAVRELFANRFQEEE